jgi:hypothetical protein
VIYGDSRRAAGKADEVMMKDWRRMLTEVGGYDNAMIGVPAGTVREMIEEIEALRADAARYRWLRDVASGSTWDEIGNTSEPETTDDAVDQSMAAAKAAAATRW